MRAKFLTLFMAAGFCALLSFSTAALADAEAGKPAPAFVATSLDGKVFDLSTLKGKVVIVNFWATWCIPCREEMPALEAVWRHNHSAGLEVLAVSADRPRAHDDVKQVMQYFTFPAALLSAVTKNDFGTLSAVPVTYVIGKDGVVDTILTPDVQPLTEPYLNDEVKKLLDAKPEAKPATPPDAKPDAKPDTKS